MTEKEIRIQKALGLILVCPYCGDIKSPDDVLYTVKPRAVRYWCVICLKYVPCTRKSC